MNTLNLNTTPTPTITEPGVHIKFSPVLIEKLTNQAWDEYSRMVGGIAFNGDKLPSWPEVDPKIQAAWRAAIAKVITVNVNM